MSNLLETVRLQLGTPIPVRDWRAALPGDTPLSLVERHQRINWRIRNSAPGYSHRRSRTEILAMRHVRRMLRAERRRAFEAADAFMAATSLEVA